VSPDERPIFLVGFMGSGKTTLATGLASALGWDLVETDELVERREGRSIEAIFRESGEGRFRDAEWEVLRSLDGRSRCVVATGGGMFAESRQRRWMKRRGRTVWLDVPPNVCTRRVRSGSGRPLWTAGDAIAFRAFFEQRKAAYALAEVRAAGLPDDPEAAVRRLLSLLR
jgi:shikimate kinase